MMVTVTGRLAELQGHLGGAGWGGEWGHGPGWWPVIPVAFWTLVILTVGFLLWRMAPARSARRGAEATLAELYARGEITEQELKQRRAVLRGKA